MDALVWLLIPASAFVLTLLWLKIAHRTRPPATTDETVDAHDRFRRAMERKPGIEASPPSAPANPADPDPER